MSNQKEPNVAWTTSHGFNIYSINDRIPEHMWYWGYNCGIQNSQNEDYWNLYKTNMAYVEKIHGPHYTKEYLEGYNQGCSDIGHATVD